MNACPSGGDLLHCLDGELRAVGDAGIVAHLEHCVGCRQHLVRLTGRRPLGVRGVNARAETVQRRGSRDLILVGRRTWRYGSTPGTRLVTGGQPTRPEMRALGEGIAAELPADPGDRRRGGLQPLSGRARQSMRPRRWRATPTGRPRVNGADRETAHGSQRGRAPADWPTSPATRSSSGWARGAWGSSTRRGSSG